MHKWLYLLLLMLAGSIALNLYLLWPQVIILTQSNEQRLTSKPMSAITPLSQPASTKLVLQPPQRSSQQTLTPKVNENSQRAARLEQATVWLNNKNFAILEVFLHNYLKQYPQDMDFLLLEARLKVETQLLSDAVAHYYDLLRFPMTLAQQQQIEQQIESLTSDTIQQLSRSYSWDILARFVEPLLQLEPNNRLYIVTLARAYAELLQVSLMENVLAALDYNDPDAQRIRESVPAIEPVLVDHDIQDPQLQNPDNARAIGLIQHGDQFVVEASLSNNPVNLLIDTGASVTAISSDYFDRLSNRHKVNYLGRFNMATAGGNVMASIYRFSELRIQHIRVTNLPVVVLPLTGLEHADGLLGMNFLREFDFKIDQNRSVILIK